MDVKQLSLSDFELTEEGVRRARALFDAANLRLLIVPGLALVAPIVAILAYGIAGAQELRDVFGAIFGAVIFGGTVGSLAFVAVGLAMAPLARRFYRFIRLKRAPA